MYSGSERRLVRFIIIVVSLHSGVKSSKFLTSSNTFKRTGESVSSHGSGSTAVIHSSGKLIKTEAHLALDLSGEASLAVLSPPNLGKWGTYYWSSVVIIGHQRSYKHLELQRGVSLFTLHLMITQKIITYSVRESSVHVLGSPGFLSFLVLGEALVHPRVRVGSVWRGKQLDLIILADFETIFLKQTKNNVCIFFHFRLLLLVKAGYPRNSFLCTYGGCSSRWWYPCPW